MKTDWTFGAFFLGSAMALGCPAGGNDDAAGSTGVVGDDDDDDDVDSNTSMNPPTTGMTGDGTTSVGPTSTTNDEDSDTEGETEGDTEGSGACEIMLPPPLDCMMQAPPEHGWRVTRLNGVWSQDGSYDPEIGEDFGAEDDPQAGGGFIGGSTDGGGDSVGFIPDPTGGPVQFECDPIAQDCPDGEKCMPWANDGGSAWNATRCSPIDANAVEIGETCTVQGSGVSGIDNCILGAMCWAVDPETNMGECIEMCSCSYENPICEGTNTSCVISNQDALTICLPVCNPLDISTCPDGQGCFPFEDLFHCASSVGNGTPQGTPCEFINACDPGQACVSPDIVAGCQGAGCCADFCNLDVDDCGAGTTCIPWYQGGMAPDECLGMTGICG